MLKVEKEYKYYKLKTDDTMLIVLLENAIKDKIKDLECLINNNIFEHNHKQYREEIERYKEYLKIL